MKIFKFGGASIKDADSVRNVASILNKYIQEPLVVVVSAMGKMTNAFETLTEHAFNGNTGHMEKQFGFIRSFHLDILHSLFPDPRHKAFTRVDLLFQEIDSLIKSNDKRGFDFYYDRIVSFGELLSGNIVSSFLQESGNVHTHCDARKLIRTNNSYRDALVLWPETSENIRNAFGLINENTPFILTEGFIGSDPEGNSTTLGREGSDYTAAIFAYALDAEEVVIWKDVPGLLNADPQILSETIKIDRICYSDAIELAYYGAKIIHPKTIKPLQNKKIPLIIKSFSEPELPGSVISDNDEAYQQVPSFIFKFNQTLISITPRDFSFINEENLFGIFGIFSQFRVRINLMQNSAISFSVCIDGENSGFNSLIEALQHDYKVKYNQHLELITIRNYDQDCIEKVVNNRLILLEQRSRATVQLLVESGSSNS
ncbi:MAG: aspartate kinase [Bacteroidales bacterium]|nr:aspartate kinase [Bacteroidales bacterium]